MRYKINIDVTYEGLKKTFGFIFREKGKGRISPIFKSTMQYQWEDFWENFPLSPEDFHRTFDILPNNNVGLQGPNSMISILGTMGAAPVTIAKFEYAIDINNELFQYAKFAAGNYSNGNGIRTCYYEQIYIVNSKGERICIQEDYTLGESIRSYNI